MYRLTLILILLTTFTKTTFCQDEVKFKIEKFGGGLLPENSKVITIKKEGTNREKAKDNLFPDLNSFKIYIYDYLNANSETQLKYYKTKTPYNYIYFIYVLTPDNIIFYSRHYTG